MEATTGLGFRMEVLGLTHKKACMTFRYLRRLSRIEYRSYAGSLYKRSVLILARITSHLSDFYISLV